MENGAFWLQGQILCEHSQTSDAGMATTDVPSIILVSIFCRFFFFRANLTATGQCHTENSILVAQH